MKTKRKSALVILTLIAVLSLFASVAAACSPSTPSETVEIYGFTVKEKITVNMGESVTLEKPLVTDEDGNVLDVYYDVADKSGGYVQTAMGSFIARDTRGYTVTYKVVTSDYQIKTAVTEIAVNGTSFSLSADYSPLVSAGDIVKINPLCSQSEANVSTSVTYGDSTVEVKNGEFTCENVGVYTVTLAARYGEEYGEYTYKVYAQEPMREGEIERYGADWSEVNKYAGKSRIGWSSVKASETEIPLLDESDESAYYRKIDFNSDYLYVYANPRADKDYYKSLQEQGYKYVKIHVYYTGELEHMCSISTDPNNNCYRRDMYYGYSPAIPVLKPNTWNEILVNLNRELDDFNRSFVDGLDYYASEQMPVLIIDNSVEWNVPGAGRGGKEANGMTIYIGGICAVKESGLSNTVSIDVATSPELDFSGVDKKGFSSCEIVVGDKVYEGDKLNLKQEKLDGTYRVTFYGVTKSGVRGELKVVDIDVYDSKASTVKYCDVSQGNVQVFDNYKKADSLLSITENAPDRSGVKYYLIKGTEQTAIKAKIFKSKEFLQNYSAGYLLFEYRVDTADNTAVSVDLALDASSKPYVTENAASGAWNVACIPMSHILNNYGAFSAYDVNSHSGKMIRVLNYSKNVDVYVGKMTVANVDITKDTTVKYFDIGVSDLNNYYESESLDGFDSYYWTVDGVKVTDTTLETANVGNGEHLVEFKAETDGFAISLYIGKIDVVLYWQDVNLTTAKAYKYGKSYPEMLQITNGAPGKTGGSYYYVHYDKGVEDAEGALKVAPSHVKEVLQANFADWYLTFEYYIDVPDYTSQTFYLSETKFLTKPKDGGGQDRVLGENTKLKEWHRVYIPMSEVLSNYDHVANLTAISNFGKLIYLSTGDSYSLNMYVSQITFSQTAE